MTVPTLNPGGLSGMCATHQKLARKPPFGKPTVWIVDDDECFGGLLDMILHEYPTRTFTALDTLDRALKSDLPEILLLDLMFGREVHAGVVFLEDLHRRHPSVLVIVVSASKDQRDAHRTGQLQAFGFIEKGAQGQSFHVELLTVVREAEKHCTVNHLLSDILGCTDLFHEVSGRQRHRFGETTRRALEYYFANIREIGPSVQEVARGIGVSESTLEYHLGKALKATPYEILVDIALLIAGSLICAGFKVKEAASCVGMDPERLRQRFQATFECPPSEAYQVGVFRRLLVNHSVITKDALRKSFNWP